METFLGIVLGGLITFLASWFFYRRASEDLRQEADELRHYLGITLRVLQALSGNGHSFSINWDTQGRPIGVSYQVAVNDQIAIRGDVDINLESPDKDDEETP